MAEACGSRTHHSIREGRIGGFEGRDSHRTIFASTWIIDHLEWESDRLTELLPDRRANLQTYFLALSRKWNNIFTQDDADSQPA